VGRMRLKRDYKLYCRLSSPKARYSDSVLKSELCVVLELLLKPLHSDSVNHLSLLSMVTLIYTRYSVTRN
jgi:hypothetical protein